MILTHLLLTEIDTAPLALAYCTPALVTTLFVFRFREELKLFPGLKTLGRFLKTIVRSLPRCSQLTETCFAHPSFLLA